MINERVSVRMAPPVDAFLDPITGGLIGSAVLGGLGGIFGGGSVGPNRSGATVGAGNFAGNLFGQLNAQGGQALHTGLGNLNQILSSQGQTDPRLMNQLIGSAQRRGQVRGDQLGQAFAGRNLGGGLLDALQLANQQGTSAEIGGIEAREAQLAEQRRRSDLELLLRLIIDPGLTGFGIERGVESQRAQAQAGVTGGTIGAFGDIIGALLSGG